MSYLGDFPVNGKVSFLWNTNGQDGASITRSTDGTLKIFKAHATAATWATERSSLAGVTQLEDFDQTGIHSVYIDLSDNTDAGFYAAGNEYQVAITGAVIDTKTVSAVLASFSIERAGGVLAFLKANVGTAGASLTDLGGMSTTMKAQVEAEVDDALGGGTGTALTAIPWNAAWDAEVQSEVDDALVAQRLDELLNADSDIDGAAPPTVGSVFHELMSKTAGSFTFDQTTDSNEAIKDALLTAAAVNAEVVDALNVDTYAEPGQEAPGTTVSLVKKIGYLYKAWRNKGTSTATEHKLYADDAVTVDQKATVGDDGTTFTKSEFTSGP